MMFYPSRCIILHASSGDVINGTLPCRTLGVESRDLLSSKSFDTTDQIEHKSTLFSKQEGFQSSFISALVKTKWYN